MAAAVVSIPAQAGDRPADAKSGVYTFGTLKAPKLEAARDQAKAWLETAKPDALASTSFAAIWDGGRYSPARPGGCDAQPRRCQCRQIAH